MRVYFNKNNKKNKINKIIIELLTFGISGINKIGKTPIKHAIAANVQESEFSFKIANDFLCIIVYLLKYNYVIDYI
ncbi:hypothetical protein OOA_09361 [Providencia burhodogranariea DSM 19968]|uniref:Uncharacterized protein n=1 Tax=Providencia burhodogranariea DSM 19968 TaxID=1141662 RepID=K8WNE7_9GAMM|nr:hypothetical protein OOA_09361 [Providencia burhodogranariea DSM 19968]